MDSPITDLVVWRRSLAKTLLWLLAVLASLAISILMAFGRLSDDAVAVIIGWAGIACSLYAGFRMVRQLTQSGPVIEVGPAGLHDHRLSPNPIPWDSIEEISVRRSRRRGSWLVLSMTEENLRLHVHSRLDSRPARALIGPNQGILVSTLGLDRSFDELVSAVERWYPPRPPATSP